MIFLGTICLNVYTKYYNFEYINWNLKKSNQLDNEKINAKIILW